MNIFFKPAAALLLVCLCRTVCAGAGSDAELQIRVQQALHADPYFYDGHVEVAVDHGVVYLKGLVFSDWDMRDAKRIAAKAAVNRRVVNDLTLVEGGRR